MPVDGLHLALVALLYFCAVHAVDMHDVMTMSSDLRACA